MRFATRRLSDSDHVMAPDGSEVRVLVGLAGGGLAHFRLNPDDVSVAVHHRRVEELWYVVSGRGQMWRRRGRGEEEIVVLEPGVALTIPVDTHFQFRAVGPGPSTSSVSPCRPWPGDGDEAIRVARTVAANGRGRTGAGAARQLKASRRPDPPMAGRIPFRDPSRTPFGDENRSCPAAPRVGPPPEGPPGSPAHASPAGPSLFDAFIGIARACDENRARSGRITPEPPPDDRPPALAWAHEFLESPDRGLARPPRAKRGQTDRTWRLSALDRYVFDLRGYLLFEHALDPGTVDRLRSVINDQGLPPT